MCSDMMNESQRDRYADVIAGATVAATPTVRASNRLPLSRVRRTIASRRVTAMRRSCVAARGG